VLRAQALPALEQAERLYLDGLLTTADAVEGVQAWIDKRQPQWQDR
jgi:cyclohexa-1,5-dienecarbonyl-CoA hydratase